VVFTASPVRQSDPLPFKNTAGVIMREEALIRKHLEEEEKNIIEQVEIGVVGTLNRRDLAARQSQLHQQGAFIH
jgi:hypothetical protein